ncbi:MAG TPA: glycosyltransferase family 1 protein [Elusimicrobiota bacterium]|nr:glycosyltransferase family 1 protein [Elusimicrobiota bacterium]
MRIALDVSAALDGASGIGFYIERLTAALASAAPEREFVLTSAFWRGGRRLEDAALPRARNVTRVRFAAPQRLLLPAEEFGGLSWRERRFRALGVDAVHGLGNVLPPLSRLPGIVTVHHVGGGAPPGAWADFFFNKLPRRSAERADRVIAVSERTRAEALAAWGLDPRRVRAVHEGGPDAVFRPGGGAPGGAPYVLHVGGLSVRKNVPALLRAFGAIVEKNPARPLRLLLAGRPGEASAEIARLSAAPPLAGRVELLGEVPREKLVALYQGAAAVAMPSLVEGFGFPVLEAMACAAPVVAADAAALPEIAGGAALLFDPDDPDGLSRALASILDDADLAADLRRRGAARAAAFSWEKAARETLEVIDAARAERLKS